MKFERIQMEPLPDYGDLMDIKSWINSVTTGGFIDYDGNGNLATEDKVSDLKVYPSDVENGKIVRVWFGYSRKHIKYDDSWQFTHIMWFNR